MHAAVKSARKREANGARSEKRIKEVLVEARRVFSEYGYEKTTTLEIARQMGISEATIFSYFSSKRHLCIEVIKAWYQEITAVLETDVPLVIGTRARLHFIVYKHLMTLMQDGTGMCKLVLSEGRSMDEEFAEVIAELKRRYTSPLMKTLSAAQKSGEIRNDMPLPLLRDMVYGSLEHVLWDYIVTQNRPNIELSASQITEMLWNAFVPVSHSLSQLAQFRNEIVEALVRLNASNK